MVKKITENTRLELLDVLRRYLKATKKGKARILDEFVAISGYRLKRMQFVYLMIKKRMKPYIMSEVHANRFMMRP